MYIIYVTPFSKSFKEEGLSYFSSTKLEIGTVVTIPLRNRNSRGMVIGSKPLKESKSEIKSADFSLKKIKGVYKSSVFNRDFLEATKEASEYFATSIGSLIDVLVPTNILENFEKVKVDLKEKSILSKDDTKSPKYVVQLPDSDRFSHYKSVIRENFAKKKSVLVCMPTIEDVMYAEENLSKGIEASTFIFHSQMKKDSILKNWQKAISYEKPALLIMTGSFMSIPRKNIGSFILDRESSSVYKIKTRPYVDLRKIIEIYSEKIGCELIVGDLMLRSETMLRYEQGEFFEHTPIKFRSLTESHQKLIDMREKTESDKDQFNIFSSATERMIRESYEDSKKVFLLVSRKGMSPIIACNDCGEIVKCRNCSSPVVLHLANKNIENNFFKCKICGDKRSADEKCKNCNSWRLVTLGIGTETVAREVKKISPEIKTFILDKDYASTPKKARDTIDDFYDSASAVLIGTEMALLYLREDVDNVCVVSIDSLFSLPDFSIREKICHILLKSRMKAAENFIIQTRNPEESIFHNVIQGNLADFYRDELHTRKKYDYPPYSLIVKFSIVGKNREKLKETLEELGSDFEEYDFSVYNAFHERVRGNFVLNAAFKIPRTEWPKKELVKKIRNLPNQIKIEVDTDSVL